MRSHPAPRRTAAAPVTACLVFLLACSAGGHEDAPVPAGVPLGARVTLDGLSFQPPAAWKAQPPSSGMRLAQYAIDPAPGDTEAAECALFHFPGQGGSVQANLDRWFGQFGQPDGSPSSDRAVVEKTQAGGLPVTYVDVSGTYTGSMSGMGAPSGPKPGYRMAAGVVEAERGPWFMKCTGPEGTMEGVAPGLKALLATVRP
ncbi:MAG TPA: hypothetical protein VJV23_04355 [Candidatus Polarisedimenticolia bacterium]|nr:hypothetical protein [Candidatus Polarisedimenticolia bacterium]